MKIDVFYLRVICMCDQCDSPFCVLQLTAPIKPNWCVLLYCCTCSYHNLIVVQPSWTTVPCPTAKLGLLISKSFVGIKQSVIGVALRTPLKNKIGNVYFQNITSASVRQLYWFYIKLSPHILQQNCAHGHMGHGLYPYKDLDINKPNFAVGHGTAVQLGCTTVRL